MPTGEMDMDRNWYHSLRVKGLIDVVWYDSTTMANGRTLRVMTLRLLTTTYANMVRIILSSCSCFVGNVNVPQTRPMVKLKKGEDINLANLKCDLKWIAISLLNQSEYHGQIVEFMKVCGHVCAFVNYWSIFSLRENKNNIL